MHSLHHICTHPHLLLQYFQEQLWSMERENTEKSVQEDLEMDAVIVHELILVYYYKRMTD